MGDDDVGLTRFASANPKLAKILKKQEKLRQKKILSRRSGHDSQEDIDFNMASKDKQSVKTQSTKDKFLHQMMLG